MLSIIFQQKKRDVAVEDKGEATLVTIRYFQLGQNAFIYIQKSQVKYTYILLTFLDARVNSSHARVVLVSCVRRRRACIGARASLPR